MGAKKEFASDIKVDVAFAPAAISTDTTTNGAVIDTADFDGGVTFIANIKRTAGTVTPKIEEDDAVGMGTATDVADANMTVTEASQALSADGVMKIGVVGNLKRYLRLSFVSTSSANVIASAVAVKMGEVAKIA